jgi:hypothetical protein
MTALGRGCVKSRRRSGALASIARGPRIKSSSELIDSYSLSYALLRPKAAQEGRNGPQPPTIFIAVMILGIPRIAMTRLRLYASTCRLISVLTFSSRLVRKCVDPIQCFKVPNTCSMVRRRTVICCGFWSSRVWRRSSTSSCSQRRTRRTLSVVHCARRAQLPQASLQYK